MKKPMIIFLHLSYWFCYLFVLFLILAAASQGFSQGPALPFMLQLGAAFALAPALPSFYVFYARLFPRFLKTGRVRKLWLAGTLTVLTSAAFASGCIWLAVSTHGISVNGVQTGLEGFLLIALVALVNGMTGLVLKGAITWFEERKLREQTQREKHEVELELVKAKLDPHFIFNSLNNIDALIHKDAEAASSYLTKLSELLRYALYEARSEQVPLAKELTCIKQFIELQRIRTKNDNYLTLDINGDSDGATIAPMLLVPIIENAFKHAGNKKASGAIQVKLDIAADGITFVCQNQVAASVSDSQGFGIGNDLLRKRLNLLYPGRFRLTENQAVDQYIVTLKLSNA